MTDPARATQAPTPLPRCTPEDATATNPPCWHISADVASCPRSDHLKIVIEGLNTLPASAHVIASCTVQPTT
ncbi:MAG TPA: hypothetical protein VF469_15040 [Kofleriaceae bacterium]